MTKNDTLTEFKREYIKAIQGGYAAVFAGAGLSRSSGFVDWKELLRDIANDINLDIDKEEDLIAVAQYHKNEKQGRNTLNNKILNAFVSEISNNENVNLLARMPISTYWTTNYDQVLENAMDTNGKITSVKITPESLAENLEEKDVTIYKMHGDSKDASKCVLTKDDYESYNVTRQLFTTSLQGELISKTFLFIGFSFDDPNLNYILSRIRILLNENKRTHYCFLRKISKRNYKNKLKNYEYDLNKQNLRVNDLLRYGIQAIMVDEFKDITKILNEVYLNSRNNNIFISGSAYDYGEGWNEIAIPFITQLTQTLYKNKFKIVTGHGRGVGSYIIGSILEENNSKTKNLEKYLDIRAFPYQYKDKKNYEELTYQYRENIFKDSGIVIFIFGNKMEENKLIKSSGVYKEFEIAIEKKCFIIPIGSTGFVALDIFNKIEQQINDYPYLKKHLKILKSSKNIDQLIKVIIEIIENIKKNYS